MVRRRRATACNPFLRWPCTAASWIRCVRSAGSPWPAWWPDTAPRSTSDPTRRARPRRGRARRRSRAAGGLPRRPRRRPEPGTGSSPRDGPHQRRRQPTLVGAPSTRRGSHPWCTAGRSWWGAACLRETRAITGAPVSGSATGLDRDPAARPRSTSTPSASVVGHLGQPARHRPPGSRPMCSPVCARWAVCIRRNTNQVTIAHTT